MKAAIIDDLPACREDLRNSLFRYFDKHYTGELPTVVEFSSGEEFLTQFTADVWDIIFIDQYMNELSGIDTAHKIREQDKLVPLVFVTTSHGHAIESYGVRACGYLVKPYVYEVFEKTMELAGLEQIRDARFICIEQEKILLREILWCDRADHYIQIHTDKRDVLRFRRSFSELVLLLRPYPQFLPCYKGCVVNADRVDYIDELNFFMDTGARVPFALREKKQLESLFNSYMFRREREDVLL